MFCLTVQYLSFLLFLLLLQIRTVLVPLQQAQKCEPEPQRVTHALFADDLVICDSLHEHTQLQLKYLEEFAIAKGLCVNVGKWATMVCDGDSTGAH
jgi:uncharacterized metal-binding protein